MIKKASNKSSKPVRRVESSGKGKNPDFDIKVPTALSKPTNNLGDYTMMVYGDSGCGKTSLAAQFPGYLTIQFEPARKGLKIWKEDLSYVSQDQYEKTNRRPFLEFVSLMDNCLDDDRVKGVSIDTFALCFLSAQDQVCWDRHIKHPNDAEDYGKTWQAIPSAVRDILNIWQKSGKGLILVDHSDKVEIKDGDNKYWRTQPALGDSKTGPLSLVKTMTDLIVYYSINNNGSRSMRIHPTKEIYCKCAIDGHFRTPSGELLEEFNAGRSPEEAYRRLNDAFNNLIGKEEKPTAKKLVSPKTVKGVKGTKKKKSFKK